MDITEFKEEAKRTIDQIAAYYDTLPTRPVLSTVEPGYLRPLLPSSAPEHGEALSQITADVESKIMPGITHWSSPHFMAFFPCSQSAPANIAEMWSNALNGAHFNWICSPAVTELETIVMDWLAKALALPACFLSGGETHGGGVILGTASEAVLTAMVAARDRHLADVMRSLDDGTMSEEQREEEEWNVKSKLVALGSSGSHSSTKKAAQILGVRFHTVPTPAVGSNDNDGKGNGMTGEAFGKKVEELKAKGLRPFYVTATLGTTDVCAVDDFEGIAKVIDGQSRSQSTQPNGTAASSSGRIWVHVDAAYAGSALLLPENQHLTGPLASLDSFNFNPHKWMLTTFDCSAFWVKRRADLVQSSLSIKPPYLRNQFSDHELVTDYRDWQIALGRRFRSLKLWFVLRSFGISGLQAHIRKGVALGDRMQALLQSPAAAGLFEIFTAARFALVTFRVRADGEDERNRRTEELYEQVNAGGQFYLTSTVVDGKFAIRVCTGVDRCQEEHVDKLFAELVQRTERIVKA